MNHRFIKFLIVGSICTAIDFVLFTLLHLTLHYHVIYSNIISYSTGLICAFFINRKWTFVDSTHRHNSQFWLSILLGYVGLVLNTAIVWYLSTMIHIVAAKCIAVGIIVFYNYFSNKRLVFRVKK